jgi:alpha-amylase
VLSSGLLGKKSRKFNLAFFYQTLLYTNGMPDVILHAFNWTFKEIAKNAGKIALAGYGAVLLPPPLYSDEKGTEWWQRYQPKDYRLIRSYLGRKADFMAAIHDLHSHGLKVYVDVVFNHMANEDRLDCWYFPGATALANYQCLAEDFLADRLYGDLSTGLFSPWDFNQNGDIVNWLDVEESTRKSISGLPDLELNDWVVSQQIICLKALKALGIDGFRVDAIKHVPIEHIKRVFEIPELVDSFIFGEALTMSDHEESLFLWPLVQQTRISYYDFALYDTIRRAFAYDGSLRELVNPSQYGQAMDRFRAVTISVTHDIPNNAGFRWQLMDPIDELLALAYLLGRDGGVPLVYSDHGESARIYPEDTGRWERLWCRSDLVAWLGFHNRVLGMVQESLLEADGYWVFRRGDQGIVAINKTAQEQLVVVQTEQLSSGTWTQIHTGQVLEWHQGSLVLVLPARTAQGWLRTD